MAKTQHYKSISKNLPILISFGFLVLLAFTVIITYFRVEQQMVSEYWRMADGITNLMIADLDFKKMDYYIKENYSSPEYMRIMKHYYQLKHNYPDVFYMYVYRLYKDEDGVPSGTIIIDLEDEYTDTPNQASIDWVGGKYIILEPFASKIDELITSKDPVFETAFSGEDGYLLSFAKPFFDENGNYIASACVDFSMENLHRQNIRFIIILGLILTAVCIAILVIAISFLRSVVTKPLLSISVAVSSFKYDTEENLNENLEMLKGLGLESDNEIGILYESLLTAEEDSIYYRTKYKKAENEILDKNEKINELGNLALRDSMTNVGNKAAFTAKISELLDSEEYGIVLMDVNDLKMINDTYGHEAGDAYIIGSCTILCDTFAHSPVFRIGGDEFAVILKGRDYINRHKLLGEVTENFEKIRAEEDDPKFRFSGSLGMADSTNCKTPRETIKAADKDMYANKKKFKEKYGSYR